MGLCAPCHWQSSLLQQMLPLTLLFVFGDPNPVTAEQNYFSGLHLTNKCLHFNLREISLFCFSQYFCHCFRQDIILAPQSVLYADRIHEVICIDHLWLKRGLYRAEREADSAAHTCRHSVIYKAKIAYGVRTQGFINLNIFWRTQNLAYVHLGVRTLLVTIPRTVL